MASQEPIYSISDPLTHLFHAQANAAAIQIDLDDFDGHYVAHADHLEGVLDVAVGQLADVHQAILLDTDIHEGTESNHIAQITNAMELPLRSLLLLGDGILLSAAGISSEPKSCW
jgi:hypothetical protein